MFTNAEAQSVVGNRYLLLDLLGEGSMGAVYRCLDRLHGTVVALKKVSRSASDLKFKVLPSILDSDSFQLALANEFQILARLRHPHIVSVLDYGFDIDKRPYFTMDLLLHAQKIHEAAQQKPTEERVHLLLQVLEALAYFHQRGIIHRDLKPENVLVDEQGQVRVLDFGLALSAQYTEQTEEVLYGTLAYMAPEILQGKSAQIQSDLYAFGLMAYNVLGGGYPFDTSSISNLIHAIINEPPDVARFESPIGQFLGRLLAKNAEDRYANVDAVIQALCAATNFPRPQESLAIRESYLQAASFVGREAETQKLRALVSGLQGGKGGVCLIAGESGVGKSRLLNEIRVRTLVQNLPVLQGQAVAEGSNPYQVWRGVLQWLPIMTDLSELEIQVLKDFLPPGSENLPLEMPNAPELSGQAAQDRLISVIVNILLRQEKPTIIILEDLQWAGEESLHLLKEVVRVISETKILILGSYRHDETPHLADALPGAEILRLNRFNQEEIAQLTHSILGSSAPEIVTYLERETEGNAFFVVETLRALAAETGELRKVDSHSLSHPVVAGGVLALLQQRLSRISGENREVLQDAAIIGRQLDLPLLSYLAPGVDLQKWLIVCSDSAVLEARENHWYFAHDKLREYLIADLQQSAESLLERHRQVAHSIEAIYGEQDSYVPALAHHWSKAQVAEKAAYYLEKSALQAIVGAPAAVIDYLEKAHAFAADGKNDDPMRQARRHSLLGNAYYALGDYKLAEEHLQEASRHLGAAVTPQQNWQVGLGVLRQVVVQVLHRNAPSRYLAKRDSSEIDRSMYAALFNKQVVYSYQSAMLKVLHAALAALNTVETLKPSEVANPVMAYGALTLSTGLMGLHSLAGYYLRLTHTALPQAGLHQQVLTRALLGMYALQRADWDNAIETIESVVKRFDEIGAFHSADESVSYLSRGYVHTGKFDRALELVSKSYKRSKQRNDRIVRFQLFTMLVLLLIRKHSFSDPVFEDMELLTDRSAAEAVFRAAAEANPLNRSYYFVVCALYSLSTGKPTEAFSKLQESNQTSLGRKVERSALYFELYTTMSEVSFALLNTAVLSDLQQAEVSGIFQESVKKLVRYAKIFAFARPRALLYQGWQHQLKSHSAQAHKLWQHSLESAQTLHMPYDEALAHAALRNVAELSDQERSQHSQTAAMLFKQLGVSFDLEALERTAT